MLRQGMYNNSACGEAMAMAAWYNQITTLTAMLDAGVPVNMLNCDGATALHVAAYAGHYDQVVMLTDRSADARMTDARYGSTARVWAQHAWQVDGKGPVAVYRAIVDHLQQAESPTRP
jgi:hypothetical protein